MGKVPSLSYIEMLRALQRNGWKVTVPAHRPIKRSTLDHILKQARISVEDFSAPDLDFPSL
jgi:predicted RNA binding protein YcfA (HicA-like mRNA interferase family)